MRAAFELAKKEVSHVAPRMNSRIAFSDMRWLTYGRPSGAAVS
jgi:hypothetical protein